MILSANLMLAAWLFRAVAAPLRWPLLFGVMCCGHAVFCGLSRGSMFFFGVSMSGTAISSMLLAPDRHKLRALLILAMIAVVGGAVVAKSVILRFNDRGNDISERSREVMNMVAAEMHNDRPLLGMGANNYAIAANLQRYSHDYDIIDRSRGYQTYRDVRRAQVESLYWGMRAEAGTIGLASLIAVLVVSLALTAAKALVLADGIQRAICIGAFWCLLANYLQCTLEHTLLHSQNLYLWLTICALVGAMPWRSPKPRPSAPAAEPVRPAALAAAPPVATPARESPVFWT
jgi:O-antigen ligase